MRKIRKIGVKMLKKKDKPRDEFLKRAAELLEWCTPIELELLRFKTGAEMNRRLENWGRRVDESLSPKKKWKKAKHKPNAKSTTDLLATPIGNANN